MMGKPTQNDDDRCAVEHVTDCGWMGINQETCEARSCCWNSSVPEGSPWCHRAKDPPPPTCTVAPTGKTDCGWYGINQEQCEARGCCWGPNAPAGEPWCYLKDFDVPPYGMCPVAPSDRVDCGHLGTTKDECLGDSCCWDDTIDNHPYCFNQPDLSPQSCYIYHGVSGSCKYVCDPGQDRAYGLCDGMEYCCYNKTPGKK